MISEEDKKRYEEAKTCNSCIDWHHHCNAECCRIIFLNISLEQFNKHRTFVDVRKILTKDELWYYKLRGVKYLHGVLRFDKNFCIYTGTRIIYYRNCDLLDGLLCRGHPNNKPKICLDFDEKTAFCENRRCGITDNCLFKYKEVIEVDEEKKDESE